MAHAQTPQQGASVAAAQNVFVKAASTSKIDSNNMQSSNSAPNAANDSQIYASGAYEEHN
jgi:hypothetical protein